MPERRAHFLINKPLQFRYMTYITFTLFIVSSVSLLGFYFGIWGGILESFADEKFQADLITASRLTEYEAARIPPPAGEASSALSFFKQAEKLSLYQREVFKRILDDTNQKLLAKLGILLFFIAWASVYLSHKIAGPLYRFESSLDQIDQGNLKTRVHLRKFDEGQSLGARFNQTLEHLESRFGRLKQILRENDTDSRRMTTLLQEELSKIQTRADSKHSS